jgi:plastocyanin
MPPSRVALAVVGCSASLLATGCGDEGADATATTTAASPGAPERAPTVSIASFRFLPASITIAAGGRVTWVNRDKAPHSAENGGAAGAGARGRSFDTGRLTRGQHRSITFSKPGTYTYYCVYHRFMEANVIVR